MNIFKRFIYKVIRVLCPKGNVFTKTYEKCFVLSKNYQCKKQDCGIVDNYDEIEKKLLDFDIVSFDVFDTLLLRKVSDPSSVFDIVGEFIPFINFKKIRMGTEIELRKANKREVTLDEIYRELNVKYGIDDISVKNLEILIEKKLITPNPTMVKIFNDLKQSGIHLIITSDMYLPQGVILELLSTCGIEGFERLFLSSELGYQKVDGSMFEYIKAIYPNKKICHVGDNYQIDIVQANKNGLNSVYYPNIHKRGFFDRVIDKHTLCDSFYRGLSDKVFYTSTSSIYYKIGYCFFGIVVYGFVQWINRLTKIHNIDNVLFASRDMYVVKDAYDIVYEQSNTTYLKVSRFALIRANFMNSIPRFVEWLKDASINRSSLLSTMQDISFEKILPIICQDDDIDQNAIIDSSSADKIEEKIYKYKDEISKVLEVEHSNCEKYLTNTIGNGNVLFVDLSGKCTVPVLIQSMLNDIGTNTRIISAQLYSFQDSSYIDTKLAYESLECWLFDNVKNNTAKDICWCNAINFADVLESIFSENKGSLVSYDNYPDFVYSPLDESKDGLNLVHKGIIDFVSDFHNMSNGMIKVNEGCAINAMMNGYTFFFDNIDTISQNMTISLSNKV